MRYSQIHEKNGCHTLIMALLADRPTISQPDSHKFMAIRLFRFYTRFPRAKFFAFVTYANDLRWICCLPAIERHQALNLTFVLQSSPSTSQLHSHGPSFVTKNCLQRQLSWLSSCLSNLFLSSIPLRHVSSTTIYQASALNSQAFPLHSLHLLQY